jgi:hypothetical protein
LDSIPTNAPAVIRVTAPGHAPLTFVARPELRLAYHLRLADAQEVRPVRQVFIPGVPVGNTVVGGCEYVDLGLLPDPPPRGPLITRLLVVPGSRPPVSATVP